MEALRQSEASERSKLQTTITRLKADMETEKIRFASDLDETMSKLKKEAEEQALQASQRQFELELRVRLYEDMYNRVAENKNELHKQIEAKDKQIAELEATVSSTRNEVGLLQTKIHEQQTALDMEEQRVAAAETARSRLEADSKSEKQRLMDQLEEMRSQLDWHKKELQTATLVREEAATAASLENQRLLEALSKERKETQKMSSLLEEAQTARQLAERKARVARSEAKRLEKDLKSALLSNPVPNEAPRNCDNQHLLEQLEKLQDTCDKLETENVGLRRSINVMSTQAHLVAEHSEKMRKNPGTASDKQTQTAPLRYNSELSHKLRAAVEVIRRLAEEKRILIELSNRHQAQIRQLTSQPNALGQSKQSPKDLVSSRTTYSGPLMLAPGNRKFWPSAPYTTCETEDSGSSIPGKESVTAIYNMLDETVSHLDGLPNRLITTKLL
ncbi:unnamed protein product [Dicrocoelium dendriticum]|nr:unnamed protein product [Dicrocoelium dendriticum]